jgi:hypothetical protein
MPAGAEADRYPCVMAGLVPASYVFVYTSKRQGCAACAGMTFGAVRYVNINDGRYRIALMG